MLSKGRNSPPPRVNNSGERNGRAKLTASQVDRIRKLHGRKTCPELAELFGVSKTTVWRVVSGRWWRNSTEYSG
jgi:hypothetical protein